MSTEKTYGFGNSSPYRSDTFNKGNAKLFGQNGPLKVGRIYNDGADIVIEDVSFVQQGVMVQKTGSVRVTFPAFLAPPFYLTAHVPDTRPVDNISWSFVRRPQDIIDSLALIAEWDGSEWRSLPKQTIKSILDYRLETARAYNNLGFNQGFRFAPSPDFSTYLITSGQITDKTGNLVTKNEATPFAAIPEDVDFERVDAILWRRLTDSPNRIGQLIQRPAGTYQGTSPVLIKQLEVSPDTVVSGKPQIFNLEDNSYILLFIEGYGSNGVLKATKYSSDRTTQEIAPVSLAAGVLDYSAVLGPDGKIFIVFTRENNLYRMKIDDECTIELNLANIDVLPNPILRPRVKADALGNYHCVFVYQAGPTTYAPYYMRFNIGGTVSIQAKRLINNTSSYDEVILDVNDDLILHVAYNNTTLGQVEYQTLDDVGIQITGPLPVSNETKFGASILNGPCRNVQVACSENNELYITWEQEKGTNQYGFVIYNPKFQENFGAKSILHTFVSATENIQYSKMELDWGNHGHILVGNGTSILYYKFFLPSLGTRLVGNFTVSSSASSDFDIAYDKHGSLILAWAGAQTGISDNSTPVGSALFGQGNFGSEGVFLGANEFAVPLSDIETYEPIPTVGDTFTVSSSAIGNNGTFLIDQERVSTINGLTYRVFRTTGSFSREEAGGVLVQFKKLNGNNLQVAKQSAEVKYSFTEILAEQLDSDTIGFMIHKPSNQFVTWYNNTSVNVDDASVKNESFLISEGIISWDAEVDNGTLGWDKALVLRDPFRGDLEIPSAVINNFADGDILYIKVPKSVPLSKDGNTDGLGVASVDDTSPFSVGGKVLIGDSDSPGVQATVLEVSNGKVKVDTSLAGYDVVRGAYILPLSLNVLKGRQNENDLKPNSLNEIDGRIIIIATRKGSYVFFRDGSLSLESGEDGHIGDGTSENTLAFIGAKDEADRNPIYDAAGYVVDGTSLRVAVSALAKLLKTKGVSRVVWVSKDTGHDTNGDGSFYKPYLTVQKAHDSIEDADATKKYAIVLAPGVYEEDANFKHTKPYINYLSLIKDTVSLSRAGFPYTLEFNNANRTEIHGIKFPLGLTFSKTVASPGSCYLSLENCEVSGGELSVYGLGLTDILHLNSTLVTTHARLHSVWATLKASTVDGYLEIDDDFGEASLTVQASYLNHVLSQSATTPTNVEIMGSKVEGIITMDHAGSVVAPTLSVDAVSYPITEAQVVLVNSASLVRTTKAFAVGYTPTVASDFEGIHQVQPVNVKEALDKTAALSRYFAQLKIMPHETDADKARISGSDITLLDGRVFTQELRNLVMSFSGAVINFTTGEIFKDDGVTPLGVDFIPFAIPANEYAWYGLGIIPSIVGADNTISVQIIVTPPIGASANIAEAPKPVIAGTKKLGGIQIFNNNGNIELQDIYQLGTGSGSGSGTGDANSFTENLKHRLHDSYFHYFTSTVFEVDEDAFVEDTTGTYDLVEGVYKFGAAGEYLLTTGLFDPDFLVTTDDARQVEVHAEWKDVETIDEDAVFEVALDGVNFESVSMQRHGISPKFIGRKFLDYPAPSVLLSEGPGSDLDLDDSNSIAFPLDVTSKAAVRGIKVNLNKTGSPDGHIYISIKNGSEVLYSKAFMVQNLADGLNTLSLDGFTVILPPDAYQLEVYSDETYKISYSGGVDAITVSSEYEVLGHIYDLKIRVTVSDADKKIKALGIFYDEQVGNIVEGNVALEKQKFSGDENKDTFTLTKFLPNPDHLKIYDLKTGQVYRYGAFFLDGHKVTFPANTFDVPGETIELLFDQSEGTGYDYSDLNANVIAANGLGSMDDSMDKSRPGFGPILRNKAGKRRRLYLDELDNIMIEALE